MNRSFERPSDLVERNVLSDSPHGVRPRRHALPGQVTSNRSPHRGVGKINWLPAWTTFRNYWRTSAIFAGAVMFVVLLLTFLLKPVYESSARVEIDPPGAEMFSLDSRMGPETGADYIETQARNMQSDALLISVVRQLRLDQVPEFTEPSMVSRVASTVLGSINRIPTLLWGKKSSESSPEPNNPLTLTSKEASALLSVQGRLEIKRDTASRLVTVSFASHDPVLSANVSNAIVHSFIEESYQTRHEAIMQSTEWLSRQLDDIRKKMEESNNALAAFQRSSGIAIVDENRSTFGEQMAELSRQKTQAQAERIQLESYLNGVRRGNSAGLPQVQNNAVIQAMTQKLSETRAELSQALTLYGKNHPNVKKLQNEAEELQSQIELQRKMIVDQMETSYYAAISRERMLDDQMRGTNRELGEMAQYETLKKEAMASADLYNALYARVKEAGIAAASKSINIRIVDQARILDSPTRPKPLQNIAIGLAVSLVGGILLAFVRHALDTRIHTLEDVRQFIGLSAVSAVPVLDQPRSAHGALIPVFNGRQRLSILDGRAEFLVVKPGSAQSEVFRGIRTSVMLSQPGNPPRVLLVASSLPGEGKSTIAINLAVSLAQSGRTCILDADLRRPTLSGALHVSNKSGLGEYLSHATSLDAVLTPVPGIGGLTLLTAGSAPNDPGQLIDSENMRDLVRQLRDLYEFIVIDSPPILPYSDGRSLAPFVDGVVFVGRAGVLTRDAMARSMELLQEVHSAPVLEFVLNGAQLEPSGYGYGYGYGA
jgi:succinoglycan biosynthesis transport protein ExoP